MPTCRGKCELQITKILTDPITAEVDTDPPAGKFPKTAWAKKDSDAAADNLRAKIKKWAEPQTATPCTNATCKCNQTDQDPTDDDWKKKKPLTRKFAIKFTSNGLPWTSAAEIEYKIAYVAGACEDPPGTIYLVGSFGQISELGVTVSAENPELIDAKAMARIKKALA